MLTETLFNEDTITLLPRKPAQPEGSAPGLPRENNVGGTTLAQEEASGYKVWAPFKALLLQRMTG